MNPKYRMQSQLLLLLVCYLQNKINPVCGWVRSRSSRGGGPKVCDNPRLLGRGLDPLPILGGGDTLGTLYGLCGTKSEHLEKKEKWTFEGESFEESLLIFGRMLADEVRRSGLRAYLPRGYILVTYDSSDNI